MKDNIKYTEFDNLYEVYKYIKKKKIATNEKPELIKANTNWFVVVYCNGELNRLVDLKCTDKKKANKMFEYITRLYNGTVISRSFSDQFEFLMMLLTTPEVFYDHL